MLSCCKMADFFFTILGAVWVLNALFQAGLNIYVYCLAILKELMIYETTLFLLNPITFEKWYSPALVDWLCFLSAFLYYADLEIITQFIFPLKSWYNAKVVQFQPIVIKCFNAGSHFWFLCFLFEIISVDAL